MSELKSPEVESGLSRKDKLILAATAVVVAAVIVIDTLQPVEDGFSTTFELIGEGLAELEG